MKKSIPPLVWALAALPRILLFALVLRHPSGCMMSDSGGYLNLAANLLHRRQFIQTSSSVDAIETFRTPGYPLFLTPFIWLFGSSMVPIAAAQLVLSFLSVLLVWKICSDLSPGRGALFGTAFFALDWGLLTHTPLILTEALVTFLLLINLSATLKSIRTNSPLKAGVCGFLWSISAFVKPLILYLPLALVWLWADRKKCFAAFLIAAYLLPGFWVLRNWRAAHYPGFSSVADTVMGLCPAVAVVQLETGRSWNESHEMLLGTLERQHPEFNHDQAGLAKAYAAIIIPLFKAHPFYFIQYNLIGAARILFGPGIEVLFRYLPDESIPKDKMSAEITGQNTITLLRIHPLLIFIIVPYLVMLAAGYVAFCFGIRNLWLVGQRGAAYCLLCPALYVLLLSSHQGYHRFRIPMLPFLAVGISAAFSSALVQEDRH